MDPSPRQYNVGLAPAQQFAQNPRDASRTTEGPKPAEWEAVKDEIRSLYEQHPLKEVKRILETRNFYATERMFKSRLHSWGFNKNSSDKEYQVAALLLHRRKAEGKHDSLFVINGNTRTIKDLRKYIKGRKLSDDQFLAIALKSESAGMLDEVHEHVRCETPDVDALDAENKQSPASAKTPSSLNSGDSPPPKQSHPSAFASSPMLVPGQMKKETCNNFPTVQTHYQSHSTSNVDRKVRRNSIKNRKKRNSESSMDLMLPSQHQIEDHERYQMEGVQHTYSPLESINEPNALQSRAPAVEQFFTDEVTQPSPAPRHSPTCDHFNESDVERLAYATLYSKSLASSYGEDNLDGLKLLNPVSSDPALKDYDIICGKCHLSTSTHFSSLQHVNNSPRSSSNLQQLSAEQSPRAILNPSTDVSLDLFQVAPSAKEHDHCFRWMSLSFLACIWWTKQQAFPDDAVAAELAQKAQSSADVEFEAMLLVDDPKLTITLNHTLTVLHMHNQKEICVKIMKSAAAVAERVVGLNHPAGVITRFLGYAGNPSKLRQQREITSQTLRQVWAHYVQTCEAGEKDMRSIGAMYCLGYLLNVEGGRDEDRDKLIESESTMRQCYQLSCEKLGPSDLQSIMAMTNLRLNMERQGRTSEAIACARKAIHDSVTTLGTQHPKRLELMRNLARSYLMVGKEKEAEELYWAVLEGRLNMLGREHIYTLAIKEDIKEFLRDRKRWRDANGDPSPEQIRLDDYFSWEPVETDSADEEKQLKAF